MLKRLTLFLLIQGLFAVSAFATPPTRWDRFIDSRSAQAAVKVREHIAKFILESNFIKDFKQIADALLSPTARQRRDLQNWGVICGFLSNQAHAVSEITLGDSFKYF